MTPDSTDQGSGIGSEARRLWRGDLPLGRAFWTYAVLGGLVVNMTTSALFLVLAVNHRMIAALIAGYALSVPYNLIVLVGVWRSAGRYQGERSHADLARFVTLGLMAVLSMT